MESAEHYLSRWESAGLLDPPTIAAIRTYEATHARPASRQWQVLLALILGAILLGAGVLLFVAAHWDAVSPGQRLALTLTMLFFFHGMALLTRTRFTGLTTALHAIGTISAGAAIALVGQIFNMQEHWPSAVLLWALCAAAGWLLLRDQFQETLTLLLTPAWILAEWSERTRPYTGANVYFARILLVLGVAYLAAFLLSRRRAVFGILFAAGALLTPVAVALLCSGWSPAWSAHWGFVSLPYRLAALAILGAVLTAATLHNRHAFVPTLVAAFLAYALPWAQTTITEQGPNSPWQHTGPNLLAHILVSLAAIFLVGWGVRLHAKPLVNYGMAAFAATVVWFYFSSVMDKLGRSLGLIVLGVLFLVGGSLLERTRRQLLKSIAGASA